LASTAGGITVGVALRWSDDGLVQIIRNWLHIY
jgi:hypothetical protein